MYIQSLTKLLEQRQTCSKLHPSLSNVVSVENVISDLFDFSIIISIVTKPPLNLGEGAD